MFARLAVVWQNISALDEYLKVSLLDSPGQGGALSLQTEEGKRETIISEIKHLMKEVDDGAIYNCDFNQMLNWRVNHGAPNTIWDFDFDKLMARQIVFGSHCYGCTAGAGSSCGGATAA
jgi:hypothetical protein